eukprot:TRINITY_DN566_c1_g1_i1.p1 TRINITY_DN566_c1_g1~~TRINITY_DN566_c1_g1_i1.p1  ORF type:complete len:195 (-),score=55.73 TRINITY_DN566_c1_g1_i1:128-712(-)
MGTSQSTHGSNRRRIPSKVEYHNRIGNKIEVRVGVSEFPSPLCHEKLKFFSKVEDEEKIETWTLLLKPAGGFTLKNKQNIQGDRIVKGLFSIEEEKDEIDEETGKERRIFILNLKYHDNNTSSNGKQFKAKLFCTKKREENDISDNLEDESGSSMEETSSPNSEFSQFKTKKLWDISYLNLESSPLVWRKMDLI